MKYAICYKGIFNINRIRTIGPDSVYQEQLIVANKNHKKKLIDDIINSGNELDVFISTYDITPEINELVTKLNSPKECYFSPKISINTSTFQAQLQHHLMLVEMIKKSETKMNDKYDILVFTRLDIDIHKKFSELPIDLEKFNITVEHASGNCDDNYWVFPRKYLDTYTASINELLKSNKMTHEINHRLTQHGCELNYFDTLIQSYMGHLTFSFIR
jgi:hypothetical protein